GSLRQHVRAQLATLRRHLVEEARAGTDEVVLKPAVGDERPASLDRGDQALVAQLGDGPAHHRPGDAVLAAQLGLRRQPALRSVATGLDGAAQAGVHLVPQRRSGLVGGYVALARGRAVSCWRHDGVHPLSTVSFALYGARMNTARNSAPLRFSKQWYSPGSIHT